MTKTYELIRLNQLFLVKIFNNMDETYMIIKRFMVVLLYFCSIDWYIETCRTASHRARVFSSCRFYVNTSPLI